VLPGITGLWQVSGRSELSTEEMAELDIGYIERRSLAMNFIILLQTIPAVVRGRGAY
jgi:lipopolysaccharide/colanic/teichoic acid biosynthesis glycosyltransferase